MYFQTTVCNIVGKDWIKLTQKYATFSDMEKYMAHIFSSLTPVMSALFYQDVNSVP